MGRTHKEIKMFIQITRINEKGNEKVALVDTSKIVFVTETEPHINYEKPVEWEDQENEETGEVEKVPCKYEETPRYLIAFDNGKHPMFLDKENYDKVVAALTK